MTFHRLLQRQLKKHQLNFDDQCPEIQAFMTAVNHAYQDFDTDRRMVEHSLELSSREFLELNDEMLSIFHSSLDLYFKVNLKGDISQVQGQKEHFGFWPTFKNPRHLDELESPGLAKKLKSVLKMVTENQTPFEFSYQQNESVFYELRCILASKDQCLIIARNITEQHQWKKLMTFHRISQLSGRHDTLHEMLSEVGLIIYENTDFAQVEVVYQPEKDQEQTHLSFPGEQILPKELLQAFWQELQSTQKVKVYLRRENNSFHGETLISVPMLHNQNLMGALFLHTSQPENIDDNLLEWLGSLGNNIGQLITKQEMDFALYQSKEAALKASQAKSEFLANMSHGLRVPLNSMIGFTKILLKNTSDRLKPKEYTYLQRVLSNSKHLLKMSNQILDLSKIEAQQLQVQIETVNLRQLLENMVTQFEAPMLEKEIRFELACPLAVKEFETDPTKLQQIVFNLMDNAIKFTPEDGKITLSLTCADQGEPLSLSVLDSGPGIPDGHRELIFTAFHQVPGNEEVTGSGLGLTLAQSLCQALDFELQVESQENQGTCFTVHFSKQT